MISSDLIFLQYLNRKELPMTRQFAINVTLVVSRAEGDDIIIIDDNEEQDPQCLGVHVEEVPELIKALQSLIA